MKALLLAYLFLYCPLIYAQYKANPTLRGFADFHCHQMANYGFGGGIVVGEAFGEYENALPKHCTYFHGPAGSRDEYGALLKPIAYCSMYVHNTERGVGWPRWDNITHQSMYEDWLYRAYRGGLRLMVMLAVNNEWMCERCASPTLGLHCNEQYKCGEDLAIVMQVDAAKRMEVYIDNKFGGKGKGWYRIAYSADDALNIIREGKLAIILGVEVDYPLKVDDKIAIYKYVAVEEKLQYYYDMGIRHLFPIHFDNNQFGGTSYDNYLKQHTEDVVQNPTRPYKIKTYKNPNYKRDEGRCNELGLTNLGKFLLLKMMERGMIIDVDHMSAKAKDDCLKIAEKYQYSAIISGHTGFVDISKDDKKHEGNLLCEEIQRIKNLGGLIAPILNQGHSINTWTGGTTQVENNCPGSSESFLQAYLYAKDKMGGRPIGIGSDFNGMINAFGPRIGIEACPCTEPGTGYARRVPLPEVKYPFKSLFDLTSFEKSVIESKSYDIGKDGLAHVGMLPDMIEEFKVLGLTDADLEPLMNSAKGYAEMWKHADTSFASSRYKNKVKINKVFYKSETGKDLEFEYIEIENLTKVLVNLKSWTLEDANSHKFTFGVTQLKPREKIKVYIKSGINTATTYYWGSGRAILDNQGDVITLRDKEKLLVSIYGYEGKF